MNSFNSLLVFTILSVIINLISCHGMASVKIGHVVFDNLVRSMTKKALEEINKMKDKVPDLDTEFIPIIFTKFQFGTRNFTFDEILYEDKLLTIKYGSKLNNTISVEISI